MPFFQARSFEGKLLNQDHMTPELYMYKNKEGGLVVLYCNDEREACHVSGCYGSSSNVGRSGR